MEISHELEKRIKEFSEELEKVGMTRFFWAKEIGWFEKFYQFLFNSNWKKI